MNTFLNIGLLAFLLFVSNFATASNLKIAELIVPATNLKVAVEPDQQALKFTISEKSWRCKVENLQGYKRNISELRLNYEETALILSNVDYLPLESIYKCENGFTKAYSVPNKTPGMLVDINLKHKLYLSVGYVTLNPTSYLATIAKLGSTKNLIRLPGSYANANEKTAYYEFDQLDPKAKISIDGRYVSPSDVVSCGGNPGVWDLKTKRAVTFPDASHSENQELCNALFAK